MKTGDVLLIAFKSVDFLIYKVRPVVVIKESTESSDELIVCAISSILPNKLLW